MCSTGYANPSDGMPAVNTALWVSSGGAAVDHITLAVLVTVALGLKHDLGFGFGRGSGWGYRGLWQLAAIRPGIPRWTPAATA